RAARRGPGDRREATSEGPSHGGRPAPEPSPPVRGSPDAADGGPGSVRGALGDRRKDRQGAGGEGAPPPAGGAAPRRGGRDAGLHLVSLPAELPPPLPPSRAGARLRRSAPGIPGRRQGDAPPGRRAPLGIRRTVRPARR